MNYFAHGRHYVDAPYVLAGTAVPDWLSVVDRRVRARARLARRLLDAPEPPVAQVALGVVAHHHDDAWFHQTRAFAELSLELTSVIRRRLPGDTGFRPSFLGHILVEILLDAALVEQHDGLLDGYYQALQSVDPRVVSTAVDQMSTGRAVRLPQMIELFCRERFLYDYLDDAKLLTRLNRVMRRVKLPELPPDTHILLSAAREPVRRRMAELLDGTPAPEFKEKC